MSNIELAILGNSFAIMAIVIGTIMDGITIKRLKRRVEDLERLQGNISTGEKVERQIAGMYGRKAEKGDV